MALQAPGDAEDGGRFSPKAGTARAIARRRGTNHIDPAPSPMRTTLLLLLSAGLLSAQEPGMPALAGLQLLEEKFGPPYLRHIFEMSGVAGDPQPLEWRVTVSEPSDPALLHEFWIGERSATDEGINDDYYPERLPKGYFPLAAVKVDSTQAFSITEAVAREAKVGFDLINYRLHGREYSREPVWMLTLLDADEEVVGSVHLSASSGDVLRTIWMRRLTDGRLSVEDSALLPSGRPLATAGEVPPVSPVPSAGVPAPAAPSAFGVAEESPAAAPEDLERFDPEFQPPPRVPRQLPPPTGAPTPAAPAEPPPADTTIEIPEIQRLNEAQERAGSR